VTFPARWTGPQFKQQQALKVLRVRKQRQRKAVEDAAKMSVRTRDRFCRFPRCGCDQFKLARHVAHLTHKGMGGNPRGDRSGEARMILLCSARHKENRISLDRKTLRIDPLTRAGTAGPCAFYVSSQALGVTERVDRWLEVARETARHVYEPLTPRQVQLLAILAEMTL
jgi:hypothetical protein